jgi:hypothetical protein
VVTADASPAGAVAIDGGALTFGSGLLALLRPALDVAGPGAVVALRSSADAVRDDLPRWCSVEGHRYLGREPDVDGVDRHLVERGTLSVPKDAPPAEGRVETSGGRLTADEVLRRVPFPDHADPATGFAPRGARVEGGAPVYPFDLVERDRVAPPEVARLFDQAVSAQWDGTRDIAWDRVRPLAPPLERALGQVMTFLAENELSALYVPARFLPRIHPAYAETAMFLATQLADEARHIDVFLKRARAGGGRLGLSSATTSRSLLTLLEARDFTEAAFLLSVLGEGTFLDLLRFVETHAPDEPTADLVSRARNDETRHVHFGMAHVRHALAHDPSLYGRLEDAVRRRAASIPATDAPAAVVDALTVLAARGTEPAAIARGHDAVRDLLEQMAENRVRRLVTAGFSEGQARTLSDLHTPNFM